MQKTPNHIAIIPDGNRRWAKEHNLPAIEGHRRGAQRFRELSEYSRQKNIHTLTAWGFSTENWGRDYKEVESLMDLFVFLIRSNTESIHKDQVRVRHLGRKDRLPQKLLQEIIKIENETSEYNRFDFNICIDYGGQDEIIRAVKNMFNNLVLENTDFRKEMLTQITPETFSSYLDTAKQQYPNPDLIIRTSGEKRTSGLLPFQSVYSELYFEESYLPDFTTEKLEAALNEFSLRDRRFGKGSSKVS